ncbi:MAG: type II toxin-antitoxin system RelE/ParE family toxin [Alphaproteobacteria bacterium]
MEARFEPLRHHPEIGPSRGQLADGLRIHLFHDYAIYYLFSETELIIVRVLHGSRDAAGQFIDDL